MIPNTMKNSTEETAQDEEQTYFTPCSCILNSDTWPSPHNYRPTANIKATNCQQHLCPLLPGGGGQGLVGVPVFGGNAGGTSSFLAGGSSIKFLVMITLLAEPDVEELKGSSLLAFNKENSNIHIFSAILACFPFSSCNIYLELKGWTNAKSKHFCLFLTSSTYLRRLEIKKNPEWLLCTAIESWVQLHTQK